MNEASTPWWQDQLTHVPTYQAVQLKIEHIVSKKYSGWGTDDRADLVSLVLEKYLWKFGKESLPLNEEGTPDVPFNWLKTVITTTAIDMHRKQDARPADPVDFASPAPDAKLDLVGALRDLATPSLMSMRGVAAQQALDLLAEKKPDDRDLIQWRHIDGDEFQAIADRMGRKKEAARKAVHRAVVELRSVVENNEDLREALLERPSYPIE